MTDRADDLARAHIRTFPNDEGVCGIDIKGMWFPCEGEPEADVEEMATEIQEDFATALRAYAEEARREEISKCPDHLIRVRGEKP
jgi:hypothetical protein